MFIVKDTYGTCDCMAAITQGTAKIIHLPQTAWVNGPGGSQIEQSSMKWLPRVQMWGSAVEVNLGILWCPLLVCYLYRNSRKIKHMGSIERWALTYGAVRKVFSEEGSLRAVLGAEQNIHREPGWERQMSERTAGAGAERQSWENVPCWVNLSRRLSLTLVWGERWGARSQAWKL